MSTLLQQQVRQFLVHSFLYYQLGESIISDSQYDHLCQSLQASLAQTPEKVPYQDLVQQALGQEGSGFSIKKYPAPIITVALHLLYQAHNENQGDFEEFVIRHGYRLESEPDA